MRHETWGMRAPLSPRTFRILVVLSGLCVALWTGYCLRAALNPFLLGALFAYMLDPVVAWLELRSVSRIRAILLLYGIGLAALFSSASTIDNAI